MRKMMCAVHMISGVVSVLFFILIAVNMLNSQASAKEMMPFAIGFIFCSAISNATKKAVDRAAEDLYYGMQSPFTEIQNRQAQADAEASMQQLTDRQNQQAMNDAMHAAEEARLAATGIEFGGYNPDPNLNPGIQSMQNFNDNSFGMF